MKNLESIKGKNTDGWKEKPSKIWNINVVHTMKYSTKVKTNKIVHTLTLMSLTNIALKDKKQVV